MIALDRIFCQARGVDKTSGESSVLKKTIIEVSPKAEEVKVLDVHLGKDCRQCCKQAGTIDIINFISYDTVSVYWSGI